MCLAVGVLQLSTAAEPSKDTEPVLELKKKPKPAIKEVAKDGEPTPSKDPARSKESAPEPKPADKKADKKQPTKDSSLDKELADSLDLEGLTDESDSDDPLEDAIGSMRSVSDRIAELDTGKETQKLQTNIVSNLNKLLQQLQQQQQSQQNQNQQQHQPKQQQKQNGDQKSKETQQQPTASKNESDDAKESTDRNSKSKQQDSILKRRALIREIWGHLPPALRDKILNVESEKPLPKYAEHVRRYYESIAETP